MAAVYTLWRRGPLLDLTKLARVARHGPVAAHDVRRSIRRQHQAALVAARNAPIRPAT
jgi:hypothetical protein